MPRYRMLYSKQGPAAFFSHLDLVRTLERAMRRAGLPVAYSEGFNPHPRFSFGAPLPVGVEGLAEPFEVDFLKSLDINEMEKKLNTVLPEGIAVHGITLVPDKTPSLMSTLDSAGYIVHLDEEDLPASLSANAVEEFLNQEQIEVIKKSKDGRMQQRNIRPGILKIEIIKSEQGLTLSMELKTGSAMNIRPEEALVALFKFAGMEVDKADFHIARTALSTSAK